MRIYKENEIVIYTDNAGHRFDTFVIFETNRETGLTHINHENLQVKDTDIELHPCSANGCTIPMGDSYSFELFKQLKEKFTNYDMRKKLHAVTLYRDMKVANLMAKAS